MLLDSSDAATRIRPRRDLSTHPPLRRINKSARSDGATMRDIADEWPKLLQMIDALDLFDEIPIVDFVPLLQSVMRLSFLGVVFDRGFLDRLDELQASIVGTDEDTDRDDAEAWYDLEDTDEDGPGCTSMYRLPAHVCGPLLNGVVYPDRAVADMDKQIGAALEMQLILTKPWEIRGSF